MSDAPLVPAPLYGLRAWRVAGDERLAGPQQDATWPAGGAWLEATCAHARGHAAPAPDCRCGIHALHPTRRAARHVLARREQIPGVVEASGAIEVHEEGFRAQRARPAALFVAPGRNGRLVGRLAERYGAERVEVSGPDDLLAWCRARGLGLAPAVVTELLGPEAIERARLAARRRRRTSALRLAAAALAIAALIGAGVIATADPGDRTLFGRTGEIRR